MLGNIFEVSIDYLLKDSDEKAVLQNNEYYVSREKGESWISYERKSAKSAGLGIACFLCAGSPIFIFGGQSFIGLVGGVSFVILGIVIILKSSLQNRDYEFKPLRQNAFIFDSKYLDELTNRYKRLKKYYIFMFILFFVILVVGGLLFQISEDLYPINETLLLIICSILITPSLTMFIYAISMMDAYELLVYNEEYVNKITTRMKKKI